MKKALLLVAFSVVNSAYASNLRSAVSLTGNDANTCTTTAPCRSFSAAIAVTVDGGEVIALDSAGYGPFTIGKSITVSGAPGVHAAISVATGNGIAVTSGTVTIRNLVFIGGPLASYGIYFQSGTALRITECFLTGFDTGIMASASIGQLFVDHTSVEASNVGLDVANMTAFVGDSIFAHCSTGVLVGATSGLKAIANVTNSTIAQCQQGMTVTGLTSANSLAMAHVDHTSIEQNSIGIFLDSDIVGSVLVELNGNDIDSITESNGNVNYTIHTFSNNRIGDPGGLTLTATSLR